MPHRIAAALLALVAGGCGGEPQGAGALDPSSPRQPRLRLDGGSARLRVEQRSTTAVPGSGGEVLLTIDDVTRGQVMTSLSLRAAGPIFGPVSLAEGDAATFALDGHSFILTLEELDTSALGADLAVIVIAENGDGGGARPALSEEEKIERLIDALAQLRGAVFIRNGEEHSGEAAAAHLRMKRSRLGDRIQTAPDFIDLAAARSSQSGEPYLIRFADGRTITAAEFLQEELAVLERR
jgi:hypothetical protein